MNGQQRLIHALFLILQEKTVFPQILHKLLISNTPGGVHIPKKKKKRQNKQTKSTKVEQISSIAYSFLLSCPWYWPGSRWVKTFVGS